jgi:hypothetical protein
MIRPTLKIQGGKELLADLEKMSAELLEETSEAIRKAGLEVAKEARALAPKRTGKYRKGLRARFKRAAMTSSISSWKMPIGHLLEFGHQGPKGVWVSSRPHMFPALEKASGNLKKEIQKIVKP